MHPEKSVLRPGEPNGYAYQRAIHFTQFDQQSIYDFSNHLKLDPSTFCSCALPAVLQLRIALRFYVTS